MTTSSISSCAESSLGVRMFPQNTTRFQGGIHPVVKVLKKSLFFCHFFFYLCIDVLLDCCCMTMLSNSTHLLQASYLRANSNSSTDSSYLVLDEVVVSFESSEDAINDSR